jgi:hypothetical protein
MSSAESLADASVEPSKAVGFDRLNQRQAQPTTGSTNDRLNQPAALF